MRVRKHVNPLKSELQVVVPPLDWTAIFADPQRPLMVDIGCGETLKAPPLNIVMQRASSYSMKCGIQHMAVAARPATLQHGCTACCTGPCLSLRRSLINLPDGALGAANAMLGRVSLCQVAVATFAPA